MKQNPVRTRLTADQMTALGIACDRRRVRLIVNVTPAAALRYGAELFCREEGVDWPSDSKATT